MNLSELISQINSMEKTIARNDQKIDYLVKRASNTRKIFISNPFIPPDLNKLANELIGKIK